MNRRGDWIQTFSGKVYWPIDPHEDDVEIIDIAHALSMVCRYSGHCSQFYSVAEHSWHVSYLVPREYALQGLLHDAAEAYLADVARPVKPYLVNYREIESANWRVIARKFGVPEEMHREVHEADTAMLFCEAKQLLGPPPRPWGDEIPQAYVTDREVLCLPPPLGRALFMDRFMELYCG